jgi:sulfur transfer complex TusBCD TusB component (DsrH family)
MSEIKKEVLDDDEAYLIVPEEHIKKIATPDTVWAKIGDDGQLEVIRWDIIQMYALEYDMQARAKQQHSQTHVICKLLVLVRDQERRRSEKL